MMVFYNTGLIIPRVLLLPVALLISPSEQGTQSKQHTGSPFFLAMRVPGGQLSLQTDRGGCSHHHKTVILHHLILISHAILNKSINHNKHI